MQTDINILLASAISLGFIHTVLGPDHYLPFIMLARAEKWKTAKTIWVTVGCGIGHVLSSVALGYLGIGLGMASAKLAGVESIRGKLAAWGVIAFGLVYTVWALVQLKRHKPHTHIHIHEGGEMHRHIHTHQREHLHVHKNEKSKALTPWVLFIIFAFGPCEPLIPLLMYPAAVYGGWGTFLVAGAFSLITIATMVGIVLAGYWGLKELRGTWLEKYSSVLAGLTILASGLGIEFLGL